MSGRTGRHRGLGPQAPNGVLLHEDRRRRRRMQRFAIGLLQLTHLLLKGLLLVFLDLKSREPGLRVSIDQIVFGLRIGHELGTEQLRDVMFSFIFKHIFYLLGGLIDQIKTEASQPLPEVGPR